MSKSYVALLCSTSSALGYKYENKDEKLNILKLRYGIAAVVLLMMNSFALAKTTELKEYQIKLSHNEESQRFLVSSKVIFNSVDETKNIELMLHKDTKLNRVTWLESKADYRFDAAGTSPNIYIDNARSLSVMSAPKGSKTLLIEYSLPVNEINYLKQSKAFESGLYEAWFPYNNKYGKFGFELEFTSSEDTNFVGNGKVTKLSPRHYSIKGQPNSIDIVVMFGEQVTDKELLFDGGSIHFYVLGETPEYFNELMAQTVQSFSYLQSKLGDTNAKGGKYTFVLVPRSKGPSYSRGNFAVITKFSEGQYERAIRTVAHEVAHFWWNRADSSLWEDWLNESFAEYSAVLTIEHLFGAGAKHSLIKSFKKAAKNRSAIYQLPRESDEAQVVLYRKGPVIIDSYRAKIGDEAFLNWLKRLNQTKVSSTKAFYQSLPKEHQIWFEQRLKDEVSAI